jgi:hypothetical protein
MPASPVTINVGLSMRRMSRSSARFSTSRTRRAISVGEKMFVSVLIPCRALKRSPAIHPPRAATISGTIRTEPMQKSGVINRGDRISSRTRGSGVHEGGIADTNASADTRSGWRAANAAAISPPYDTPQIVACSRPTASIASTICST